MDAERSPTTAVNAGNLAFTFRVSKDILETAYAIKVSQDLANWSDVPTAQITVPWPQHPTAADSWLMEVKRPLSANATDFLRIAIRSATMNESNHAALTSAFRIR